MSRTVLLSLKHYIMLFRVPPGMARINQTCVHPEDCQCRADNGRYYDRGQQIMSGDRCRVWWVPSSFRRSVCLSIYLSIYLQVSAYVMDVAPEPVGTS